jgi:hypothetical protein
VAVAGGQSTNRGKTSVCIFTTPASYSSPKHSAKGSTRSLATAEVDSNKPIDALALAEGRYVLRYLNGQDQRVVACEFDAQFRTLSETRANITEWEGADSNFDLYSGSQK